MSLKKIIITGFSQSGKSSLIKFLDYHPNINAVPTHEKISEVPIKLKTLSQDKEFLWLKKYLKDSSLKAPLIKFKNANAKIQFTPKDLRKILSNFSNYYVIETHSKLKLIYDNTATESFSGEKFDFDFYKFDKKFFDNIFSKSELFAEEFIDTFYKCYFESWNNYKSIDIDNDYFLYPDKNLCFDVLDFYLKENFNFKCFFVYRNVKDLLISNSLRSKRYLKYSDIEKSCISNLYKNKFNKKYELYLKKIKQLQLQYPENFYLLNIDDFLKDIKKNQLKICEFLKIEFSENILFPTLSGIKVSENYFKIGDKLESKYDKLNEFLEVITLNKNLKEVAKFKYLKYIFFSFYYRFKSLLS